MKFVVTDSCIGCGMCAGVCPEVFQMTDDGVAEAVTTDVDDDDEISSAIDAQDNCPVGAIEEA